MTQKRRQHAGDVLERVRATSDPTRADAARNLAGVVQRLKAVPALASHAPGNDGASFVAARVSSAWLRAAKVMSWIGVGLGGGIVGYIWGRADGDAALRRVAEPSAPTVAAAAAPASLARSEPPTPAPAVVNEAPRQDPKQGQSGRRQRSRSIEPQRNTDTPPSAEPAASDASGQRPLGLAEALELLRNAEAALRRSDGLQAQLWLSDLDRRAPRGLLAEERLVTAMLAACALGESGEALEALERLERLNPESIYRSRVESSCVAGLNRGSPHTHEHD